jgi:hypothetical protein
MAVTKRVDVVALKSFTYGTRQLVAGDRVTVMPMEARTLNAMAKTRFVTEADKKAEKDRKAAEKEQHAAAKETKKEEPKKEEQQPSPQQQQPKKTFSAAAKKKTDEDDAI